MLFVFVLCSDVTNVFFCAAEVEDFGISQALPEGEWL